MIERLKRRFLIWLNQLLWHELERERLRAAAEKAYMDRLHATSLGLTGITVTAVAGTSPEFLDAVEVRQALHRHYLHLQDERGT
jgi:hypothetical protein